MTSEIVTLINNAVLQKNDYLLDALTGKPSYQLIEIKITQSFLDQFYEKEIQLFCDFLFCDVEDDKRIPFEKEILLTKAAIRCSKERSDKIFFGFKDEDNVSNGTIQKHRNTIFKFLNMNSNELMSDFCKDKIFYLVNN